MTDFLVPEEDNPGDITLSEDGGVRYLHFGTRWIQGAMSLTRPNDLVLSYTQQMMGWLLFERSQAVHRMAVLGLGAGAVVRFCHAQMPKLQIDVVEINPAVTAMCQAFFKLPTSERVQVIHADAQEWTRQAEVQGQYDVLLVDLYDAYAEGPSCSSADFYQGCYEALGPDGICVINLFGAHESYAHNIENISKAFKGALVPLPEVDEGNIVVLAFKGKQLDISIGALLERAGQLKKAYRFPALKWVKGLLSHLGAKNN